MGTDLGVHTPGPSALWFLSSAFGAPISLLRAAPPIGHEFPSPVTTQRTNPHTTLCQDQLFTFSSLKYKLCITNIQDKDGSTVETQQRLKEEKYLFINIYFYQQFMIYKALAALCKMYDVTTAINIVIYRTFCHQQSNVKFISSSQRPFSVLDRTGSQCPQKSGNLFMVTVQCQTRDFDPGLHFHGFFLYSCLFNALQSYHNDMGIESTFAKNSTKRVNTIPCSEMVGCSSILTPQETEDLS